MSKKRYALEFEDEAVRQVIGRGYSVADLSERLGVRCPSGSSAQILSIHGLAPLIFRADNSTAATSPGAFLLAIEYAEYSVDNQTR
jgi:hypothetical protein